MGILANGRLSSLVQASRWSSARRFGNLLTQCRMSKQVSASWVQTIANTPFTSHLETTLESPADCVRLIVPNNTNAIPGVAAVASTGSAAGLDPASGTPATANPDGLTQNNSGVWSHFLWGGASTVSLAAGSSANEPAFTVSDWLQQNSQARSDASTQSALPVHYFRILLPSSATVYNVPQLVFGSDLYLGSGTWANDVSSDAIYTTHRLFRNIYQNADGVTTPTNFTQNTLQCGIPMIIQYGCRTRGMTVMVVGDSISEASPTPATGFSTECWGWAARACFAVSTQKFPVELAQFGWGGQTSAQYTQRFFDLMALTDSAGLPVFLPDVLIYSPFSPNDGSPTQALINTQAYQTARVLAICQIKGILPIIWTALPNNAYTSAVDAFRQALNTQIRNMGLSSLYLALDFDSAVSTGGNPEQYKTGYSIADGEHPSDTGHQAIANVLIPVLQAIVSSN